MKPYLKSVCYKSGLNMEYVSKTSQLCQRSSIHTYISNQSELGSRTLFVVKLSRSEHRKSKGKSTCIGLNIAIHVY